MKEKKNRERKEGKYHGEGKMPKIDTLDALGDEMTSILNILKTYSEHTLNIL